ncbi:MAG TPA: tryptophan synthase subunit alpha [Ferruginibacter sp.]|nr:tryptophan synthase subunit alpha [Ferruginibacter sp.]
MNKLDQTFSSGKKNILNIYCTAGYPQLESTATVMLALQESGADIIELGIPYSDPIADGPVIQQSNMQALQNGISIQKIFSQLNEIKEQLHIPVILMGYLNPVMQYGMEYFLKDAADAGVSGIILPDLPMYEYEHSYKSLFEKYGLHFIFLISPQTSDDRIKKADRLSKGFIYAVSSAATTGKETDFQHQQPYFKKIKNMKLKNPVLIGFGIKDKSTFELACSYASGAIIGSAYIKALEKSENIQADTALFIKNIRSL